MKKIKLKNKKYIGAILLLILILTGLYLAKEYFLNKEITATVEEGNLASEEALRYGTLSYNVNYKTNSGTANPKGCNNTKYNPSIVGGKNIIGPFTYPVKMTFKGTIDDNLMVNGKIVDANMQLEGSKCSHKHYLEYSQIIPANQTITLNVIDNHGGEALMVGALTFEKISTPGKKVKLEIQQYVAGKFFDSRMKGSGTLEGPKSGQYDQGSVVKLVAKPDKGSQILWDVSNGDCRGNTCEVKIDSDTEIVYAWVKKRGFWDKCKFGIDPINKEVTLYCSW